MNHPDNEEVPDSYCEACHTLIYSYRREKESKERVEYYKKVISLSPEERKRIHYTTWTTEKLQENLDEAIKSYEAYKADVLKCAQMIVTDTYETPEERKKREREESEKADIIEQMHKDERLSKQTKTNAEASASSE